MSYPSAYYDYWQDLWDHYAPAYFEWCNEHNMQADLSDFSIYLEEQNLIGDDEIYGQPDGE